MALQGHPRSLILAPIESAYAISYWSSTVTLVISCRFRDIAGFLLRTTHPSTRILAVFPLDYIADVVYPSSEDPTLIIRVINFKLVQPIRPWYINVTDRQTDERLTIAILRFALCASCGNEVMSIQVSANDKAVVSSIQKGLQQLKI